MTILQHSIAQAAAAATGYQIARSLRFNSADSANLTRTPSSAGNRRKWTWSGWVKRSSLSTGYDFLFSATGGGSSTTWLRFNSSNALDFVNYTGSSFTADTQTLAVFRDLSAWYHILLAYDSDNATAANRVKIYVNNVLQSMTGTSQTINTDSYINAAGVHKLGLEARSTTEYFSGYMADIYFIDGQALTPSSFGETDANTGVWIPKAYTGTYGTNGFWLKFDDNSGVTATTLGKDSSGNGNNWTPNNFSVTAGAGNDSLVDSPTNYGTDTGAGGEVRGNYATLNPLQNAALTLANGNLDATGSAATWRSTTGTLAQRTGKFYYEVTVTATTATNYMIIGVARAPVAQADMNNAPGALNANSWGIQFGSPSWKVNNGYTALGSSYSYTTNDVLMVAVDVDAGRFWFGKNGTWIESGNPATGANPIFTNLTGEIIPMVGVYDSGNTGSCNFGQRPFAYTAPSGFKALNTQNLPTPAVARGDSAFEVVTWTGDGVNGRVITSSLNFGPDFIWAKSRGTAAYHTLNDIVRGTNAILQSNTTTAEQVGSNGYVTAFNSNGFAVSGGSDINANATAFVGWLWDAGTSTVTNTNGTISSQVRANAAAGISIVTYSGVNTSPNTVGHGLGAVPKFWLIKNRSSSSGNWVFNYVLNGVVYYMFLNSTAAANAQGSPWSTLPSSSVVTLGGNDANTCQSGSNYVMYAFAEVAGFSKFGSYTGNGSADGVFVYLGFRPRFIMGRDSTGVDNWWIYDSARNTYNVANSFLRPNLADAEGSNSTDVIDFLSNGFKIRGASNFLNENGNTFIYAAFAEAPFNYARAR